MISLASIKSNHALPFLVNALEMTDALVAIWNILVMSDIYLSPKHFNCMIHSNSQFDPPNSRSFTVQKLFLAGTCRKLTLWDLNEAVYTKDQ